MVFGIMDTYRDLQEARRIGYIEGENRGLKKRVDELIDEFNEKVEDLDKAVVIIKQLELELHEKNKEIEEWRDASRQSRDAFNRVYSKFAGLKAIKDHLLTVLGDNAPPIEELIQIGRQAEYEFLANDCKWGEERAQKHSADPGQQRFWSKEVILQFLEKAERKIPEPAEYEDKSLETYVSSK